MLKRLLLALLLIIGPFLAPVGFHAASQAGTGTPWWQTDRSSAGIAPRPEDELRAAIQVYAARTYGWRGAFAVHTWIAVKPAGAAAWTRYDVVGWGGGDVVRTNHGPVDGRWYGNEPALLLDLRGAEAERLIGPVRAAVADYPYGATYRSWPGPNSNTFTAHIARSVPALGLDLPATAIGKDYRPLTDPIGAAPSGGGLQLSLLGVLALTVAPEEGVEVNLLGLGLGIDVDPLGLRLPGVGTMP